MSENTDGYRPIHDNTINDLSMYNQSFPHPDAGEGSGKVLRWVKAIERWPNKEKRVFYRIWYPDGINIWGDGHLTPDSGRYREDQQYLEWLEETDAPATQPMHIGIDMAKGPDKTAYLKYHGGHLTPITKEEFESHQPPESVLVQQGEVPEEIKDWMDDCAEADSDDDVTLWRNGAIAMYHKMDKDRPRIGGDEASDFAKLKWSIGQIMWNHLSYDKERNSIEANPATHRIAEMIYTEITRLKDQNAEITNDRDVWKEWYEKSQASIASLTSQLEGVQGERDAYLKTFDLIKTKTNSYQTARERVEDVLKKYPKQ